jgi:hypothetical protein
MIRRVKKTNEDSLRGLQICISWSALNEVADEWTHNQLEQFIAFNSLKFQINKKTWIVVLLCSMHQIIKVIRGKWNIQYGFTSTHCKIQVKDVKDGTMLIPFNYYFRDDTWLLDFIVDKACYLLLPILKCIE